jgi:hypothetical protein
MPYYVWMLCLQTFWYPRTNISKKPAFCGRRYSPFIFQFVASLAAASSAAVRCRIRRASGSGNRRILTIWSSQHKVPKEPADCQSMEGAAKVEGKYGSGKLNRTESGGIVLAANVGSRVPIDVFTLKRSGRGVVLTDLQSSLIVNKLFSVSLSLKDHD